METKIVKIKSINKIDSKSKRYDIQTKKTNNFFANNILVHNSFIQVYWDWNLNKWCVGTTGTAEAEGEINNKYGTTFSELFWTTITNNYNAGNYKWDSDLLLNKNLVYVFELTTPYNIVVKPHGISTVTLLTVRNRETLVELDRNEMEWISSELGLPLVKRFDLNAKDVGLLLRTFEEMTWQEEGYVVVDGNFNRIKIKNPAYVAVHLLKSKTAEHNIITIVKSNEIDEFASTFPDRRDEVLELKVKYDQLIVDLSKTWDKLQDFIPANITKEERKKFATAVFDITKITGTDKFTGLFFSLQDGKVNSITEYVREMDDKKLYYIL